MRKLEGTRRHSRPFESLPGALPALGRWGLLQRLAWFIAIGALAGAESSPARHLLPRLQPARQAVPHPAQLTPSPAQSVVPDEEDAVAAACAQRRAALAEVPALAGAPAFELQRPELLARAKAEPVLFLQAPLEPTLPPRLARLRAQLFSAASPWAALEHAYRALSGNPRELRAVVLTDGYLYATEPALASLLATAVSLERLFEERELVVTRGSRTIHAVRKGTEYEWLDGPESGTKARLWLLDRVTPRDVQLGPARHVEIGALAQKLGTREIVIERLTADGILARLRYAEVTVPSVLRAANRGLELECEVVPSALRPQVEMARARGQRLARVVSTLREHVSEQVEEGLPFDEPKTEEGQQDGKLRAEWRKAYLRGERSFMFNEDKYWVFNGEGRPKVPQVCADFIVDTWERMAGTWWLPKSEGRARTVGRVDFEELAIDNRRSVEQLIGFARAHPDWFEVFDPPRAARVQFRQRRRFFQRLHAQRGEFQPADVVAILGPRDDEQLHYHSFFVLAADPLTGMPTWLAANAGRPRVRTWEAEMQNAPRRVVVARIRPRLEWLEQLTGAAAASPGIVQPGRAPG